MNRNRIQAANQEREEAHQQNGARGQARAASSSSSSRSAPVNQHFLNPHYQNPVDLLRSYNRNGRANEPEENIYERLDNDVDVDDGNEEEDDDARDNAEEQQRREPPAEANGDNNHTYERIDDRSYFRGGNRNEQSPSNLWNFIEPSSSNGHYDHPRYVYGRTINQSCLSRFGRLGRNCFSSENIASATSSRRYVYQLGPNRMCHSCSRFPFVHRYACHYCNAFHDRMRYYDAGNSASQLTNSRHYIYQVTRSCRCPFCRGDYHYARFPMNTGRFVESLPRECQCRAPGGCACRGRIISNSNSAIYVGKVDRFSLVPTVDNPLYANPTIYIGRIDRSSASGLSNASGMPGNPSTSGETGVGNGGILVAPVPSTSGSNNHHNEPAALANQRAVGSNVPATSGNPAVCSIDPSVERQHVCDDSCIRSHPGSLTGVCQYLGRNGRPECQHGRVAFHWWFVNRWLPSWNSQGNERGQPNVEQQQQQQQQPPAARVDESRERPESDTEESRD